MKQTHSHRHLGIQKQACRWAARLADSDHTVTEINTLERWLAADPEHRRAFDDAQRVWQLSGQLNHLRCSVSLDDLSAPNADIPQDSDIKRNKDMPKRANYWLGGLAVAATALLAVILSPLGEQWWPGGANVQNGQYATGVGQMQTIELADGSHITLGARSILTVQYDDNQRRIFLHKGEAFFDVAKREDNPFYVTSAGTLVRVLGTRFDVKNSTRNVRVSVEEGVVQVSDRELEPASVNKPAARPGLNVNTVTLSSGQQAIAARTGELQSVRDIHQRHPGAWRTGRLYYEHAPLQEVVDDANRYSDRRIQLATPDLGKLEVTGSFRTNAIDDMLTSVTKVMGLQIEFVRERTIIKKKVAIPSPHSF